MVSRTSAGDYDSAPDIGGLAHGIEDGVVALLKAAHAQPAAG
jgi:hypothetical protein